MADTFGKRLDARDAEILTGHIDMIQDPFLQEEMGKPHDEGHVRGGGGVGDVQGPVPKPEVELIQQRVTDVEDIQQKLLEILLGVEQPGFETPAPKTASWWTT